MAKRSLPTPSREQTQAVVAAKVTIINQPIEVKLFGTQGDALERLVVLFTNVSDNLYNIAGIMGAQLTSLKQTEDALKDSMAGAQATENQQLEASREAANKPTEKEKKEPKNPFQKLLDFLDGLINILIPFIVGFFVGLKKELGLIVAVALIFRKQLFSIFKFLLSKLASLFIKQTPIPGIPGKGPPGVPDVPGKAPGAPGTPDMKPGKPGKAPPSGLDNFLKNAQKVGKSIKDLFVGIADTIAKVLGKLGEGIKNFISKVSEGIKKLLQNVAKGIESFGKGAVLKGAAALLVVSGALFVAAKAFQEFGDVKWEAVAKGLVGITGLILVMKLLDKGTMSMIKGAAALTIMSGALFLAGKAFQQFADVDWETLAVAAVGIVGLTAALVLLGPLLPSIALGAVALTVMSVALTAFGVAVQVLAAGLPALTEFIQKMSVLDGVGLITAAAGITAIGVALMALGAGQVIQALGNFVSGILSFGKEDIFTKLTKLGEVAGDLNQLPSTIEALGKLSNFEVSSNFMKNVDTLSAGLKKIAESAMGFEKTGDSLTALAKIAEVMNKPAAGGAPGGAPAAAGGAPAAAGGGPQVRAAGAGDQLPVPNSPEALAAARRAATIGTPAGRRTMEGRVERMEGENKIVEDYNKKPPGMQNAIREQRALTPAELQEAREAGALAPVATAPQGTAMNADSQNVAGAPRGGGGSSQNVVAPVTTNVNNSNQSQNVSIRPNATPTFGMQMSGGGTMAPTFGF